MIWNYENVGKRNILIACELRNTGTRTSLMTGGGDGGDGDGDGGVPTTLHIW